MLDAFISVSYSQLEKQGEGSRYPAMRSRGSAQKWPIPHPRGSSPVSVAQRLEGTVEAHFSVWPNICKPLLPHRCLLAAWETEKNQSTDNASYKELGRKSFSRPSNIFQGLKFLPASNCDLVKISKNCEPTNHPKHTRSIDTFHFDHFKMLHFHLDLFLCYSSLFSVINLIFKTKSHFKLEIFVSKMSNQNIHNCQGFFFQFFFFWDKRFVESKSVLRTVLILINQHFLTKNVLAKNSWLAHTQYTLKVTEERPVGIK